MAAVYHPIYRWGGRWVILFFSSLARARGPGPGPRAQEPQSKEMYKMGFEAKPLKMYKMVKTK